jgi:hypothetical protein
MFIKGHKEMNEYLYETVVEDFCENCLSDEEIMIMNSYQKVQLNRKKNYQKENLDEGIYNDFYSQTC